MAANISVACSTSAASVVQRTRHPGYLGITPHPVSLLDGLPYAGHGFHPVAGVEARGVDQVAEPGPARQAGRVAEGALGPDEQRVQRRISAEARSRLCARVGRRFVLRAAASGGPSHSPWRETEMGRDLPRRRGSHRPAGVGRRGEHALLDLPVQLPGRILPAGHQGFQLLEIPANVSACPGNSNGNTGASARRMTAAPTVWASARP